MNNKLFGKLTFKIMFTLYFEFKYSIIEMLSIAVNLQTVHLNSNMLKTLGSIVVTQVP